LRRFLATNFTRLIPFDRERAQLESLDEALDELGRGRSVLMFPEGTRSPDGAVHDFKSGAGYLALRSGCDVLPIHISGTYQVLGKGSLIPRRAPVEIRIGRVIVNADLRTIAEESEGAGAYRKLADHMRAAVLGLIDRPSRLVTAAKPDISAADEPVGEEHKRRGGARGSHRQAKA
jgi:long-chain acyl-CoA synthetase